MKVRSRNAPPRPSVLTAVLVTVMLLSTASQAARIKDIANVRGVRPNQLVGYGLVVGLDGSGDSTKSEFTLQSLASMLERMGGDRRSGAIEGQKCGGGDGDGRPAAVFPQRQPD
jgi:flagellar basal body P-ring protein FlgI